MKTWNVTTQNRTAAKRLLNAWHDSRVVRTWTLSQLSNALDRAVGDGLMTHEGIARALGDKTPPKRERPDHDGDNGRPDNVDENDFDEQDESHGNAGNGDAGNGDDRESDGDGNGDDGNGDEDGDGDATGGDASASDAEDGDAGESDAENGDASDGESGDGDSENESDSNDGNAESESDGEDESDELDEREAAMQEAHDRGFDDGREGRPKRNPFNDEDLQDAYDIGYSNGASDNGNDNDESDSNESESNDNEDESNDNGESEREDESHDEDDSERCDCCKKRVDANELNAAAEGTPWEGHSLCNECDALNNGDLRHAMFDVAMKYIRAGLNVAFVGPAGSGKSYLAHQIATHLDLPFYVNGAMMSKYDLIGYCDAHGEYHDTPAYNAFVSGGLHCFDELDASAPEAVVAFNGMTDDQRFYTFPCGQREQHDDYVAIACMNTWGNGASADYVGRFKQDAASMSRFVKVFIDYDRNVERFIAGEHVDIVERVWHLREACDRLGIRHIVSTRMVKQAATARQFKVKRNEIDRDILFAGLDDGAIEQVKATIAQIKAEG